MKNNGLKKILLFIATAIVALNLSNVYAKSDMKVTKKSYINTGINGRIEAKFKTNKGYAYCITPHRTGPNQGTTLKYQSRKSKGGLVYLLDKAKTDDTNYLATQIAVWKYNNNYVPDVYKKNKNKSVVKKAYALADEAEKHSNYNTTPTLSVSSHSGTLTETSDRNYYQSKDFTVNASNNTSGITVTLKNAPSGTKIVDKNGNGKTTVSKGEKFYVRVPYNNVTKKVTFKIVVKTSGKISYVERYSTGNTKWQDLSVLVKENKNVKDVISLTVSPNKRTCEIVNGKYYGKSGKIVDKTTYSIECEKHTCEKVGDKYFGKDGKIVDKTTYSIECEKHTCEMVGDKYFGKDGNIVDKTTYSIECEKHSCENIDGKYFGKDGTEVDKTTYTKECEKHTCEVIDDTYFGKNGFEVDKDTYTKECEKHTCELVDDTYFGKDGTEVDEETYSRECEDHTCEIVDDKYFGKDGTEVDYDKYKSDCMHICQIYDNHYYGSDGEITSEEEYKMECDQVVDVPDTGNISPLNVLYIMIGSALIGGTVTVVGNTKYSVK